MRNMFHAETGMNVIPVIFPAGVFQIVGYNRRRLALFFPTPSLEPYNISPNPSDGFNGPIIVWNQFAFPFVELNRRMLGSAICSPWYANGVAGHVVNVLEIIGPDHWFDKNGNLICEFVGYAK
jgi:hypothetical protein